MNIGPLFQEKGLPLPLHQHMASTFASCPERPLKPRGVACNWGVACWETRSPEGEEAIINLND